MKHPEGFPSKLARLRAHADMTQKDLAAASGISVPQIGRYETGLSRPRMNALIKLAKALNVEITRLQDANDEPASISITLEAEGIARPANMPQELYETVEMVAERLGISMSAALMVSIETLTASMEGKEPDIKKYLRAALEYLNEEANPPSK